MVTHTFLNDVSAMFNGQLLFNRVMHVKLDEKSMPKDFGPPERAPVLPRKTALGGLITSIVKDRCSNGCTCVLFPGGLSGIGLGLGPGGQPIDASQLNRGGGGGMGNMGPGGKITIALSV